MKSLLLPLHRLSARVLQQQLGDHKCIQHWHILYHILDGNLGSSAGDPYMSPTIVTEVYVSGRLHQSLRDNTSRAAEIIYLYHLDTLMHYVMGRKRVEKSVRAAIYEWCTMHHITEDDVNIETLYRTWTRWRKKYLTNIDHRELIKPVKRLVNVPYVRRMSISEADSIAGLIISAASYYFISSKDAFLPMRCQRIRVYLLHYYAGLPYRDISKYTGIKETSCRVMTSRFARDIRDDDRLRVIIIRLAGEIPTAGRSSITLSNHY